MTEEMKNAIIAKLAKFSKESAPIMYIPHEWIPEESIIYPYDPALEEFDEYLQKFYEAPDVDITSLMGRMLIKGYASVERIPAPKYPNDTEVCLVIYQTVKHLEKMLAEIGEDDELYIREPNFMEYWLTRDGELIQD